MLIATLLLPVSALLVAALTLWVLLG
jgi:hypothetical protein